ncbi:hypothetical protein MCA2478 [Methylococcus capsulatus str. Bath]|uniref:Uncharacterized protein n=1 Tax=Methylococcus capsulatus (strain ATCC 33009 / NCIMB 11132 / Bath) TaxID=243233 RepID=Q604R0_METCA|nr:hypothetical protein MCA2478 [Methylococcus capsulatus str. Bath]
MNSPPSAYDTPRGLQGKSPGQPGVRRRDSDRRSGFEKRRTGRSLPQAHLRMPGLGSPGCRAEGRKQSFESQ